MKKDAKVNNITSFPHLDLVVVPARDEKRLLVVEADAPDRPLVLVKLLEEGAHAVVPQLDDAVVQRGQDPGSLRVEGQALHPGGLGLELGQHGGDNGAGTETLEG